MNVVVGNEAGKGGAGFSSGSGGDDPRGVMHDARQRFMAVFRSECDAMTAITDGPFTESAIDQVIKVLHRMAGLGGTVGFPRVSARAAELEEALRVASIGVDQLRDGVSALQKLFDEDVNVPVKMPTLSADGASLTVLLVEDEAIQRAVTASHLRKAGHRAVEVASGDQAVAMARAVHPDVILLDVEMPGLNGHAVCRLLKADPELATIPIAFLSAHSKLNDRLEGLSQGADDFLTKPIDARELAVRLQLLNSRRSTFADRATEGVLKYETFRDAAAEELERHRGALALIRTPADRAVDLGILIRDEIRRRDLCGEHDRTTIAVLLPDTSATSARDRMASIVEKCRATGTSAVYAGIAASPAGSARTFDALLEEADEALAIARYENVTAALRPEEPRGRGPVQTAVPTTVLIADDDPDVARILDAHLGASGFKRTLVFDGSRALEELRAQRPDVLILDLMMPRMNGFDVLAGLRDLEGARPRIIVLSARGREDDVIRAFSLGADDFMTKPFNPQELLARVARLVK